MRTVWRFRHQRCLGLIGVVMLDVHYVRENFDIVREQFAARNFAPALLDNFTQLDDVRRSLIRERDELNAASNRLSKEVGGLMREGKKDEAETKKAESRAVAEKVKGIEAKLRSEERRVGKEGRDEETAKQ